MRRVTLRLPEDLADEAARAAKEHGISMSQYMAFAVAYRLGRENYHDEIAEIHRRLNDVESTTRRGR